MALLVSGRTYRRWDAAEKVGPWGNVLGNYTSCPCSLLLSASWLSSAEQLSFTTLFYHDVQFELSSRAKELANHGLEPLKHELN